MSSSFLLPGGNIARIEAALNSADYGFQVYLVRDTHKNVRIQRRPNINWQTAGLEG